MYFQVKNISNYDRYYTLKYPRNCYNWLIYLDKIK